VAALYARVDAWATAAGSLTSSHASAEDVDLDGEPEYLLYNDRMFAIFERLGGRMVAAWVRDLLDDSVFQTIGNQTGFAGSETEEEGATNVLPSGAPGAYRTSALKDWWDGTRSYVNDLYTFTDLTNGWSMTSSDGRIRKTVTLSIRSSRFEVRYETSAPRLYVRHGFSPDLQTLLLHGQRYLQVPGFEGGKMTLRNAGPVATVTAILGYADEDHNAQFNFSARDEETNIVDYTTINMRNQAQTHQVEIFGSNTFSFSLGFAAAPSDLDGNSLPDAWEARYGLTDHPQGGPYDDADGDSVNNLAEYIAGTNPTDSHDYPRLTQVFEFADGIAGAPA